MFARILVIYFVVAVVFGYNFDANNVIVYENPGEPGNLFGYSVSMFEGSGNAEPWIQIGSPKSHTARIETGNVYRCGIKSKCEELGMNLDNVKINGSFMGISMDISPNGDLYLACGHRHITNEGTNYYSKGFCHWGKTNESSSTEVIPFSGKQTTITENGQTIYDYGQGQAGFSAQFLNTMNRTEAILGAPGVRNWAGIALLLRPRIVQDVSPARRIKRSASDLSDSLVPSTSLTQHLNLLGYSVTSGKFFGGEVHYAAGAPRADMIGQVMVFSEATLVHNDQRAERTLTGRQYGEYFGGSLAAADVNGDGYDDLIVGAPTHKHAKYNEGKVYVYYGSESNNMDLGAEIAGKAPMGQFGDTVASLGDMDGDGYQDIAVAATYEDDGSGVVYVYRGTARGLLVVPTQVIRGKAYETNIRGFGRSISRPADIDSNRYKDLAIGAFKSENAFLFRAKPVVTLQHWLRDTNIKIKVDDQSFSFTSCFAFASRKPMNRGINIIPKFTIDERYNRASFQTPPPTKITLNTPDKEQCDTYTVNLMNKIINKQEAITYNLKLTLEDEDVTSISQFIVAKDGTLKGDDSFSGQPVRDPSLPNEFSGRLAGFDLGCAGEVCVADLNVEMSVKGTQDNSKDYIIGSSQFLTLVAEVENKGEKAYYTQVNITRPESPTIPLRSIPTSCRETERSVICFLADPLETNAKKTVELELEMEKVNSGKNTKLQFDVSVSTSSENRGPLPNALIFQARREASISITGRSKDEYYQFDNTSSKVEFAQIFQIQKVGWSSIDDISVKIDFPSHIGDVRVLRPYEPTLAPSGEPINCRGEGEVEFAGAAANLATLDEPKDAEAETGGAVARRRRDAADDVTSKLKHFTGFYLNCTDGGSVPGLKCASFYCNLGMSKEVVEIQFKYSVDIGKIPSDILGESDVLLIANSFNAKIRDAELKPTSSDLTILSVLIGPNVEKKVPIWIIIVAVLSGILVLAVIAAVLYKLGFFRRKNMEKLKEEMKADNEVNDPLNATETDPEN